MARSRKKTAPKRQTRLAFTPATASSSPGIERTPGTGDGRLANVRFINPSSSPLSNKRSRKPPVSSSSPVSTPQKSEVMVISSSDDHEDDVRAPSSGRGVAKKPVIDATDGENDSDPEGTMPSSTTKRRTKNGPPGRQTEVINGGDGEDDSDSDIFVASSPVKRRRKTAIHPLQARTTDGPDDSDSGEVIRSSPMKRKRRNVAPAPQSESTDGEDGENGEDDSGPDDIAPSSPMKRRRRNAAPAPQIEAAREDDSDSEDIIATSPVKRRRMDIAPAPQIPPENRRDSEDSDLAEDLADLQDSDTHVTKTRTRGRAAESSAKLKRKEQLEALKRRRAGEKVRQKSASPSEESSEGSEGQEESSEDELVLEEKDSDIESAVPEDLDEYEDDFVLQDDHSKLGAPAEEVELPFEFSRHRYKRLRDHFKDVIEWMVHNKLNPAFARNDKIYQAAFTKVKDELTGVAGSQLTSSVWNRDFIRAMEARPVIEISGYPASVGHPCDACNRSKHPASYDIRFDGKPYLEENLEPVSEEDADDSDEDSKYSDKGEPGNVDRHGNVILDASKHFYLGRNCKAKAEMNHILVHWRYHLNEWVIDYLENKGIFSNERILERERWSMKRRRKYANDTVDMMDSSGEIDRLYKDFDLNIKNAKGLKETRW